MSDEQLGFEIEFDAKTQAYFEWVAPERMETKIQKFLAEISEGMSREGAETWWNPPYSTKVMEATLERFGDWETFTAPDNHELADGFIRFLGECFIRRYDDITWSNHRGRGVPLYDDIGPAVEVNDTHSWNMVNEAEPLFDKNYGPDMVEYIITKAHRRVW